jgi:hypothetical protein
MSNATTQAIKTAMSECSPKKWHRGHFRGDVARTFFDYDYGRLGVFGNVNEADSWHIFESFKPGGKSYAYLFVAADLDSSRIYKVGVTRNIPQRFQQFCAGLPPILSPRKQFVSLFDSEFHASLCEESVLVHCRHLWIGGEWLLEGKEATDGELLDV